MICNQCKKENIKLTKKGFCNQSCSSTYTNLHRDKSIYVKSGNKNRIIIKDKVKKKTFKIPNRWPKNYIKKSKIILPENRKKLGGYREGSGRSKSGYYRGIYSGSTYELCWIIYNLDHNIKFSRFQGELKDNTLTYIPDFILDSGELIEIKGYYTNNVDRKTDLAISLGYKISVLYKEDLKHIFDYVKQNYHTSEFNTLYDNFKPEYRFEYVCVNCKSLFKTFSKRRMKNTFCCRKCYYEYKTAP